MLIEGLILLLAILVVGLALFFDYTNGFHDAANVVATIIATGAMTPRKALFMAAICEFIGPFLFGTAVAQTIGKGIIDISAFDPSQTGLSISLVIAALIGAIAWNLITWFWGLPSSSSHALVGGMMGAVLIAYGPDKILWKGLLYVDFVSDPLPCVGFDLRQPRSEGHFPSLPKGAAPDLPFFQPDADPLLRGPLPQPWRQ